MEKRAANFIEEFVEQDLASGRTVKVHTRFPPEPNGYLHIGHAKALCIDFGIAEKYGGTCNLRFDDTNPTKEDTEFVLGIQRDIQWLGYKWENLYYASDFFERLYEIACDLIRKGVAYVDDQTGEEMRRNRGTLTTPGVNSPYRDRSVEENLDLFRRMKEGEFPDKSKVLRAKIDMASPNVLMRDPALYRILRHHHHRTGDEWCIYPMYDFQHPLQDAIEGISHSLCSLEYEIHRPLYDWVVRQAGFTEHPPRQIEFARLNITRTVMSKRYLRRLVEEGYVAGWDDPRMPTLVAMRRRGYPPEAVRDFIDRVGVAKADSTVEGALLEHCVREALANAPRVMAVLNPVKVTLSNWPEGQVDEIELENHPDFPEMGTRKLHFTKTLYIEREDFMEDPPKKFFRLAPGREVRLKGAYIIQCDEVVKDENGEITELICSVDLTSRSGGEGAARKVKGTLHWLSDMDAVKAEARLYEPILNDDDAVEEETPAEGEEEEEEAAAPAKDFIDRLNPDSLKVMANCLVEPAARDAEVGARWQFLRMGYFCKDPDSTPELPVFNRVVPLKDTWAKVEKK